MAPTDVASTGREPAKIFDSLVAAYSDHHPGEDVAALAAAFAMGTEAHEGQRRETGDDYVTHPLIVAEMGKQAQDRVAEALHRLGLPFNVAFEIGSTDTVKHYVSRGLGVGIVSGICLSADEWQRLTLLELPKEYGGTTEYGVVLRRDKYRSAGLGGFLKLLGVVGKD